MIGQVRDCKPEDYVELSEGRFLFPHDGHICCPSQSTCTCIEPHVVLDAIRLHEDCFHQQWARYAQHLNHGRLLLSAVEVENLLDFMRETDKELGDAMVGLGLPALVGAWDKLDCETQDALYCRTRFYHHSRQVYYRRADRTCPHCGADMDD